MIDDDLRPRAPRAARSRPTTRSSAARRRTPTSSSRRARRSTRYYARLPGDRRSARWTASPSSPAAQYQPVRLRRRAGRRARDRADGLGRRDGARDGRRAWPRAARRSACSRSGSTARSPSQHFARGAAARPCAPIAVLDRTKEPGSDRRAALPGRRRRRSPRRGRAAGAVAMPRVIGGRYGLVVQGVHAGAWSRRSSTSSRRPSRRTTSPSASTTTSPHTSLAYDPAFSTEPDDVTRARVLRPRRRRHGRRQQELDQDHRRGDRQLRAGLLRLRLEEVGLA